MRIAIAQLNYHIGNFEANTAKSIEAIQKARSQQADLVIFPELAICGYPSADFLEFRDFISKCRESIDKIAEFTDDIAVLIGAPDVNPVIEGKDLFNAAFFIHQRKVKQVFRKTLLPTYDVFDEYRYFEANTEFSLLEFKGRKFAVTICEDIWNEGNENPMYMKSPMEHLVQYGPECILNLSASPFDYNHSDNRLTVIKANTSKYKIPVFYANHVGAQTELIFDGGSLVVDAKGEIYAELPYFKEDVQTFDLDDILLEEQKGKTSLFSKKDYCELMHDALLIGIRDYFGKLGFKKAILGLSGGIDSALTLALAVKALGAENVRAVMMPSPFSSDHSISDSEKLVENLGCPSEIIPISGVFDATIETLKPYFENIPFNVAEENIQARIRMIFLMGLANKFGYILLNTSNKSEAAVGYGTLYGDMAGGLSVLGDVYKNQVYELAKFINRNEEIIPENIITKPPSAELRPGQKDSDSLPDYDILDKVLYQYIELRKGPKEIIEAGFEKEMVNRVLKLVNINEYKRAQTPPILRVSSKAFGTGRRMPIVGKYLS